MGSPLMHTIIERVRNLNEINECLVDLKMAVALEESNIELARKDEDFNVVRYYEEFNLLLSRKFRM